MAKGPPAKRQINLRLVHNGVHPGSPLDEPLRFGLQDSKGEVHPGITQPGEARNFDLILEVTGDEDAGRPVFRGGVRTRTARGSVPLPELEARGRASTPLGSAHQNSPLGYRLGRNPGG